MVPVASADRKGERVLAIVKGLATLGRGSEELSALTTAPCTLGAWLSVWRCPIADPKMSGSTLCSRFRMGVDTGVRTGAEQGGARERDASERWRNRWRERRSQLANWGTIAAWSRTVGRRGPVGDVSGGGRVQEHRWAVATAADGQRAQAGVRGRNDVGPGVDGTPGGATAEGSAAYVPAVEKAFAPGLRPVREEGLGRPKGGREGATPVQPIDVGGDQGHRRSDVKEAATGHIGPPRLAFRI